MPDTELAYTVGLIATLHGQNHRDLYSNFEKGLVKVGFICNENELVMTHHIKKV